MASRDDKSKARGSKHASTPQQAAKHQASAKESAMFTEDRGVFMISIAAELAGMHPQTLRVYEGRGLIKPSRSPKQTRLYSQRDVERLQRIQELTTEFGLNLAGVEQVLQLEEEMAAMRRNMERLQKEAEKLQQRMIEEIEAVHRSYRRELVRWEPPGEILRAKDLETFTIPIRRDRPRRET